MDERKQSERSKEKYKKTKQNCLVQVAFLEQQILNNGKMKSR